MHSSFPPGTVIIDLISREYRVVESEEILRIGVRRTGFISMDLEVTLKLTEDRSPKDKGIGELFGEVVMSPPPPSLLLACVSLRLLNV